MQILFRDTFNTIQTQFFFVCRMELKGKYTILLNYNGNKREIKIDLNYFLSACFSQSIGLKFSSKNRFETTFALSQGGSWTEMKEYVE